MALKLEKHVKSSISYQGKTRSFLSFLGFSSTVVINFHEAGILFTKNNYITAETEVLNLDACLPAI
jgi:uncharacterized protein YdeI (YjbR/CyaY-like superfamily)